MLHYTVITNISMYCRPLYNHLQDCDTRGRRGERSIGGRGTTGREVGGRFTGGEPLGVLQTARLTVEEVEEATDFQDDASVTVMMPGEGVGGEEQEV